ncbi:hypothetical protein BDZ94DRAFT_1296545 [Collybia nuda]|uniref:DUF6533 domain-containing protein n=1 Tax=Collybia nuda TaxID=64659 RepID=A0A9P5YBB9_9AGAR|nr:hypothetical protein BDZ94DRAFT_1296545 [Collybia nuda]
MSSEAMGIVDRLAGHPISLYLHASAPALLLVDWLSTLDTEAKYAWTGRWNIGRIFYFLTRYSAFVSAPVWLYCNIAFGVPPSTCSRIYLVCSFISVSGVVTAELIMTVRVYALWGKHKGVGILLLIMSTLEFVASAVTFNIYRVHVRYFPIANLPGCLTFALSTSGSHSWPYIPLLVHQTLIFLLTAIKGYEHYSDGLYNASLIHTFYRDGIIYYALLVAFSAGNIATTHERSDMTILYFLAFLQQVIHSILSSRMLLHLRQQASAGRLSSSEQTSINFATIEEIEIAEESVLTTESQLSGGHDLYNHGWFGPEEAPSHHSQTLRQQGEA